LRLEKLLSYKHIRTLFNQLAHLIDVPRPGATTLAKVCFIILHNAWAWHKRGETVLAGVLKRLLRKTPGYPPSLNLRDTGRQSFKKLDIN
jgi:hypothetical protein